MSSSVSLIHPVHLKSEFEQSGFKAEVAVKLIHLPAMYIGRESVTRACSIKGLWESIGVIVMQVADGKSCQGLLSIHGVRRYSSAGSSKEGIAVTDVKENHVEGHSVAPSHEKKIEGQVDKAKNEE